MNIAICYPPIYKDGRIPMLGQNRFFKFSSPDKHLYPLVPSIAATLLSRSGFDVAYIDGINEGLSTQEFLEAFRKSKPDIVAIETKTPVVEYYWHMVDRLKEEFPDTFFVMVGDHVTCYPRETLEKSFVDFVLTGGDYDLSLLKLAVCLDNSDKDGLPKGLWYREEGRIKTTGKFELTTNLDALPFIDRKLTKWWLYGEAWMHRPCTYMIWGRGCVPGKCSYCSWSYNFWCNTLRLRSVNNVLDEIEMLVESLGVKEIFDETDNSTANKKWLTQFCHGMIERGLHEEVKICGNSKSSTLDRKTCRLMKKAGFRLLKVGLESGNDKTLKLINRNETVNQIRKGIKNAKDAGLNVFMTIMVGYPWETKEDFQRTLDMAGELMLYKTHIGDSLQASVIIPYPGTPLYLECIENDWFLKDPKDYDNFDMSEPLLKSPIPPDQIMRFCNRLWRTYFKPKYVAKTFLSIRSLDDLRLLWRGVRSLKGHLRDF